MSTKPAGSQFPVFVALKMSSELAQALKRTARKDDRTVSGFLRRVIAAAVQQPAAERQPQPLEHGK